MIYCFLFQWEYDYSLQLTFFPALKIENFNIQQLYALSVLTNFLENVATPEAINAHTRNVTYTTSEVTNLTLQI